MKKAHLFALSSAGVIFVFAYIFTSYEFNSGTKKTTLSSSLKMESPEATSEIELANPTSPTVQNKVNTTELALAKTFSPEKEAVKQNIASPMGIGSPEDHSSRAAYEFERLHDPSIGEIPHGIRARELAFAKKLPRREEKVQTWNQMGELEWGGRTRAVKYDVLDTNFILAGGVTGGLYRSVDGGANFAKTTDPGQMHSVTSITQDTRPGKENVWYAGTGENYGVVSATGYAAVYSGDGIFKSTDGGQSWLKLASTSSGSPETTQVNGDFDYVSGIVIDHTNSVEDIVFASVFNGIFKSTDGGLTWTESLGFSTAGPGYSAYTEIEITPSGILYATVSRSTPTKGYYRSDDAGVTWTEISVDITLPSLMYRTVMAANPSNENEVYFLAQTPSDGLNGHQIYKYTYISGDGTGAGGNWEERSANLPDGSCTGYFTFDFGFFNSQSSYDMLIEVDPADGNTVYIGGTNLYRSTDAFASDTNTTWIGGYWCRANPADYVYDGHHPDNHALTFNPLNPNSVLSGTDGGISITRDILADSVGWEHRNKGYQTTQFYTVAIEEADVSNEYVCGGLQDNGTWLSATYSPDSVWKHVHRDDGAYCAIPEGRDYYIFSSQLGKVYKKSLDANGAITNTQRIDPTGAPSVTNFINPLILDPANNDQLYTCIGSKIWRNSDVSQIPMTGDIYGTVSTNWSSLNNSLLLSSEGSISCLETSKAAPDAVFYGSKKSHLFRLDSAGSATQVKTELDNSLFPTNSYMSSVSVSPFNADEILVTFCNYGVQSIFHSNDGGLSFVHVSGNLEEVADGTGNGPAVFWGELYPDGTYYVGTTIGLFSTTLLDGDNTVWVQEGANEIGNVVINMITSRPFDGKVVVATHGGGMYYANATPAFADVIEETLDNVIVSIYPNPAEDQLTIEYTLNQSDRVKIQLFDINGKLQATLKDEIQPKGNQQLSWGKIGGLSAGVYSCVIAIGSQTISKRVVVN